MEKTIEIPFGAKDSELKDWEYTIPENMEAEIKDGKIIVREKENEDEKIRKQIIGFFSGRYALCNINTKEAIAYLERQKEQKPLSIEKTELNSIAFLEQMGYTCIPPRKEQKPASGNSEKPNNHAEWSEDDKRKINRIYEILGHAADDKGFLASKRIIWDKEAIELQDFLKSLRPQPNWKPSEEQMKVLNKVINGEVLLTTQHKCLESLYTDIKKL